MKRLRTRFGASLLLLTVSALPLRAEPRELRTVELAGQAVHALSNIPLRGIPADLVHGAAGVAVIPHVVKAGLVIDGKFGRGVILVHQPDGRWSNPIFVTFSGGGIGLDAGVEETDLVLVFKTRDSLDRALRGHLTLGRDVSVAAGPLGREAVAATDRRLLKAEIYTYSRSRGLFAGVSLEGAQVRIDSNANEGFYGLRGGRPQDVLIHRGQGAQGFTAVETLKSELAWLAGSPVAPVTAVPVQVQPPIAVAVPMQVPPPPVPVPLPPPPRYRY